MRILITNIELASLTGTITVVRDLARNLRSRGHVPVLYALVVGPPGEDLRNDGFLVVDDPAAIDPPPDVIHCHHNLAAVMALAQFPGCPGVWLSHGRTDWFDRPPRFGRIRKYMAVDRRRRAIVSQALGIPLEDVEILHNAVDLKRIPDRPERLPRAPRRALVFTKWAAAPHLLTVENVCRSLGIASAAIGKSAGRITKEPEHWLVASDIVFATGRSALEALCSGAAVIVGDHRGLAGLVTSRNYAALRDINFGSDGLIRPLTAVSIRDEILRYDADDAALVSHRARADADIGRMIDRLEQVYMQACAEQGPAGWTQDDTRSLRAFLADWPVPAHMETGGERVAWAAIKRRLSDLLARHDATSA